MHYNAIDIYNDESGNSREKAMTKDIQREIMNIVITGHVDHGKSTIIIIDAPSHVEFLKNMVTGASRAEAALLVMTLAYIPIVLFRSAGGWGIILLKLPHLPWIKR